MKADFSVTIPSKTWLQFSCWSVPPREQRGLERSRGPQAAPKQPPSPDHQSTLSGSSELGVCWGVVLTCAWNSKWPVGSQDDFIYICKVPVTLRKLMFYSSIFSPPDLSSCPWGSGVCCQWGQPAFCLVLICLSPPHSVQLLEIIYDKLAAVC